MHRVSEHLSVCLEWEHLRRTGAIAVVVGTWLTLYNQGAAALDPTQPAVALAIVLNYLTPFVVANWGLVSRRT